MGSDRFQLAKAYFESNLRRANAFFAPNSTFRFETTALDGLRDVSFDEGRCRCTFPVTARVSNGHGTLHGGCTATLVDCVTTAALLTSSDLIGVSVHLSVSYLSAVQVGEEVEVTAQVLKTGSRLAYLEAELRRVSDGKIVATGGHVKYLPGTKWAPTPERSKL